MISNNIKPKTEPDQQVKKIILDLFESNKLIDAEKEIYRQIKKYPNSSILYNILGAVLAEQNQLDKAIINYKKAIKINSNYAQAYNNLGAALHKQKKADKAVDCYKKALRLKKDFAEAFNNMGNATRELGRSKESVQYFEKAIQIKSDYAEAYHNLGSANAEIGNKKKALENYQKAIKIKPDSAEICNSLGLLLTDLGSFDEAISNYNKAIKLQPDYEKPYNNLGNLQNDLGKFDIAANLYHQALKIKPYYPKAYSNLLFNLNYKTNFDIDTYLSEARKLGLNWRSNKKNLSIKYTYEKNPKKLKIGFVSADFGNHPGGYFTLSTLRELRKKNFELISYSCFDRKDEFVHHFKPLFSKWHSIAKQEDKEVVEQIVKDGIHILIDMQGHSAGNRLPIFIYKPAPIQASWLAQGSTGIAEIDYFIGSHHITPMNEEKHFLEKILRLPEISQCFTPPDFDLKINSLPAVKNNFITFGSLNKLTKINDDVIALWSKILSFIPNSKLLLKSRELDNQKIYEEILKRFKKCNINKDRLILRGKSTTRKELINTYNEIDICLDPFPFQGNTSTCEAVWMGVPTITLKGNRYLFHFGESINSNLNMQDWIAENHEEYVVKAIKFSSNFDELSKIRINLREKALCSSVFDAPRFVEHFSTILWEIWKKFNVQK